MENTREKEMKTETRKMKYLAGVALLVLCMVRTAASELYETKTFDEINQTGMQVGDKLFSNFSCVSYTAGALAVAPESGSILVTGVYIDGNYGIRFNAPWLAGQESVVNSTISFQMLVVPGSDMYVSGNLFALAASSVGSQSGLISAVETVWDAEPGSSGANRVSSLGLVDMADPANQKLTDYRDFYVGGDAVQLKEIWVRKDITLVGGGAGEFGLTHLSEFTQTFAQIPEPASMGMLGSGIIVAMLRRSKSRKWRKTVKMDDFGAIDSMILAGAGEDYVNPLGTVYAYAGRDTKQRLPNF